MTPEEQAAADAVKAKADADAKATLMRTYSEEEFKKVVAERQEAKEKLRALEEAAKKAADEKAKQEGKLSELLAERETELAKLKTEKQELSAKAAKFEEQQAALRKQTLDKITDPDMRKFAEDIPSIDKLAAFADKVNTQRIGGSLKHQLGQPEGDYFTREQVQRMSVDEVRQNLDKINKSMATWTT